MAMISQQLEKLVSNLKSKLSSLKSGKKSYNKVGKTESMRVEIRSRRAQQLIAKNLKIADSIMNQRSSLSA